MAGTVPEKPAKKKRAIPKVALLGAAAVVLAAGGFFAWQQLASPPPPPPPPPRKAPVKAATKATPPTGGAAATTSAPTPSDTLNAVAKAPVNAINKAKDVVAARAAGGQADVSAITPGDEVANKPAAPEQKPASALKSVSTVTSLSPGVSATADMEAAAEASPAFRSFVANAKIGGVAQVGTRLATMIINGRLARAGETVDSGLGIIFEGIDSEKRNLIFKDKGGAVVTRRY